MNLRSYARDRTIKLLYEGEIWAISENKSLVDSRDEIWHNLYAKRINTETLEFIQELFNGVLDHLVELDEHILNHSAGWKLDRISHVTRNILRLALWEIIYKADIPDVVSIDEAIELAKKYCDQKEAGYVNALLENVVNKKND